MFGVDRDGFRGENPSVRVFDETCSSPGMVMARSRTEPIPRWLRSVRAREWLGLGADRARTEESSVLYIFVMLSWRTVVPWALDGYRAMLGMLETLIGTLMWTTVLYIRFRYEMLELWEWRKRVSWTTRETGKLEVDYRKYLKFIMHSYRIMLVSDTWFPVQMFIWPIW